MFFGVGGVFQVPVRFGRIVPCREGLAANAGEVSGARIAPCGAVLENCMPKVSTFTVVPKLPPALEPLLTIANNLWWCWDHEAIELFYRIDRALWDSTGQNPVSLLGEVTECWSGPIAADTD